MLSSRPVVWVAMATYQGKKYLESQVRSVLTQEGVDVHLVVSDDGSTDGTREWLADVAARDSRVTLLPPRGGEPGVAANFMYAFDNLQVEEGQFAAFADQDDIWWPGKLRTQVEFLRDEDADAVSSNVLAFTRRGGTVRKEVLRKDQDQVAWDYIFEAPSAGSTFLLTFEAWRLIVGYQRRWGVEGVALHDWFAYVVVRAAGMKWAIDARPHVAYRQHSQNALGAHKGPRAALTRFLKLRSGHYREQFLVAAEVARRVGTQVDRPQAWLDDLEDLRRDLEDLSAKGRLGVLRRAGQIRRKRSDQVLLAGACILGVW